MSGWRKVWPYMIGLVIAAGAVSGRAADPEGFEPIFDGQSLTGWDGNPEFWSVRDGAITGETTAAKPTKGNTFLIWRQGEVGDFELKLQYRIVGGNSGIQYRSFEVPDQKWVVGGYQADFEAGERYSGICYGERFRGILADRGQKTVIGDNHKPTVVGSVGDSQELQTHIKKEDWNEYHIVAQGFTFVHRINGHVTCEVVDEDRAQRRASGIVALQLHAGPPMKVQFRNIRLKRSPSTAESPGAARTERGRKKVVFLAGGRSHGYGAHDHLAGCMLLAKSLEMSGLPIEANVYHYGWPQDPAVLEGADCVVMYGDGGKGHMVNPHLAEMDALAQRGVGVVCLHYAVEVPAGETGNRFLDWIGGYFEMNWSVNPHWTARFEDFPEHPITRGVQPFEINDEWYYHMRFREGMQGVTPILTDLPPDSTLTRPDGPHSGNPAVRAAIAKREPQHVAWAAQRPNGGRGFGFTGGHVHWNWSDDNFRRLVLNAIVWCAGAEVPRSGVVDRPKTLADLETNHDETPPANFDREAVRAKFKLPPDAAGKPVPARVETPAAASPKAGGAETRAKRKKRREAAGVAQPNAAVRPKEKPANPDPAFESELVTSQAPQRAAVVDIDIQQAKQLYLIVSDGGNGFSCDWANWAEPRLIGPAGEKKLTELTWKSADADWGKVSINKNAGGGELKVAGEPIAYGIGTHANSVIVYDLPDGYTRFRARGCLDDGGTSQQDGKASSVQFYVFTADPGRAFIAKLYSAPGAAPISHDAKDAVAQLKVHPELAASLFASEPELRNPTNIDIDHRGRVWVCEVINYRKFANKDQAERVEGDRILVLEDTDGNGQAEKYSTFYQGRDIDSAHGICVLATPDGKGTRAIVSASGNVLVLTDDDGDLRADRKEILFTGIAGAQHDHGIHAFVFGPDGKLYFNFGNEGKQLLDRNGQPVRDAAGNVVNDQLRPYQQGMVFRCNLDGSGLETLGWNFRNNWEVAVDSFGTLWQSDNDDDGNRGTR
ncbi:MAG: PVC-type heme-binding CxxCH protein, partial [Pirellulaceae bacterium]